MKYQLTIICELDDELYGLSDFMHKEERIKFLRDEAGVGEIIDELASGYWIIEPISEKNQTAPSPASHDAAN